MKPRLRMKASTLRWAFVLAIVAALGAHFALD
jgi:hypothetical protein